MRFSGRNNSCFRSIIRQFLYPESLCSGLGLIRASSAQDILRNLTTRSCGRNASYFELDSETRSRYPHTYTLEICVFNVVSIRFQDDFSPSSSFRTFRSSVAILGFSSDLESCSARRTAMATKSLNLRPCLRNIRRQFASVSGWIFPIIGESAWNKPSKSSNCETIL